MKTLSKSLGLTINDIILCALSQGLSAVFKDEQIDSVQLMIPANIRFSFYNTREDVKLENKFAAIPLRIPIFKSMTEAYSNIKKTSSALRNTMSLFYGVYALSFWSTLLFPRWLVTNQLIQISGKFTMAFSNTPGPIKPFFYKHPESGIIMKNLTSQSYLMVAGDLGLAMCAIS